jgi:DNA-binding PadR family transcriptional regulator
MHDSTKAILRAFLEDPSKPLYGLQICDLAGLKSGTIHPALARLELEHGWLESFMEEGTAQSLGRGRRRYYRLTENGAIAARQALAEAHAKAVAGERRSGLGRRLGEQGI